MTVCCIIESKSVTLALEKSEGLTVARGTRFLEKNDIRIPSPFHSNRCYSFKVCINILNINFPK